MTNKKRLSSPVKKIIDAASAEEVLGNYATADAAIRELNAQIDQQITKLREKYALALEDLTTERDKCFEGIQDYAESNAKLFIARRSYEMTHGTIGFRTGTPKVKPLNKKFTFASITELVKEFLPKYLRTVEELDKEKIIADRGKIDEKKMEQCGMQVVQDETFFIELKTEEAAQK
jgi:phage host-nuclease inhibitor protein Gam